MQQPYSYTTSSVSPKGFDRLIQHVRQQVIANIQGDADSGVSEHLGVYFAIDLLSGRPGARMESDLPWRGVLEKARSMAERRPEGFPFAGLRPNFEEEDLVRSGGDKPGWRV